ncbi:MAG TPA: 30S ribosomal protein S12 methylthiotransferase RimO [Actinomycetota bacterium]|nr:30S ribosomal protein S12 methylthiotransferase RimO [Actinomycetota bacterium]
MPRVAIVTLGCPKNAVDSEGLGGLLQDGGHVVTDDVDAADVVVVNTCGFIDPARRETIDEVLELAELKDAGGLGGLVLTGCLVARAADDLDEALPEVDALVDFAAYPRIAGIVDDVASGTLERKVHGDPGTRFDPAWWDASIAAGPRVRFGRAPWAYVKIAEGCDRGCTFCAIPLMRGKFRSRAPDVVEREVRALGAQGVSEISLVSQDSVMWGRDVGAGDLTSLLRRLERVDGVRRIRLMYLHPHGVTDELVDTIASSDVVCSYFDLSLQHVAPRVLARMGRWGGRERFERIVARIRALDPLAGVRATFILGFPGETDDDARAVESFVGDGDLDWIGVFTYSREEGTRSHGYDDHVPDDVARARAAAVSAAAEHAMDRRARDLAGARLEVLAERLELGAPAEPGAAWWTGRSQREAPEVDGEIRFTTRAELRVGDYVDVRVTGNEGADLFGVHDDGARADPARPPAATGARR